MSAARDDGVRTRRPSGRTAGRAAVLALALALPLAGCAKEGRVDTAAPWGADPSSVSAAAVAPTVTVTAAPAATPSTQSTPSGTSGASGGAQPVMVGNRVTARRSGVSFEVPDGWRAIDPALATSGGTSALPDSFRTMAEQSGQTADEFLRRIGTLMDVLVMAPPSHGFSDNVSVIPTPALLPSPQEMREQLQVAGAAVVSVQRLATPVGEGVVATSRITIGTKVVASRSIALELNGTLIYITVSASEWNRADSIADRILRTLRRA